MLNRKICYNQIQEDYKKGQIRTMDVSLNARIYTDLKAKIVTGIYKEDGLPPTELQLQKEYGVSRAPVRQALGRLENDGLIIRKAGKGTFVANRNSWQSAVLGGFRMELMKKSDKVVCKVIGIREIVPPSKVANLLETAPDEKVVLVERVRIMNNHPFQYLVHYVRDLSVEAVKEAGDIEDMPMFLARQGFYLYAVREEIGAVKAGKIVAAKLDLPVGAPLLHIRRSAYDALGKMYEYMTYYTETQHWKYRVQYTR